MTPLSDPLPLRETSAWPGYGEKARIPWVFGRATVKALRYSASNRMFVLADHALDGVDAVTVNARPITGWNWRNGADVTGHAVAFLELAEDPGSTAVVAARVRGGSGEPADILAALGVTADLQELRVALRQTGLVLGGALSAAMTRRAAIQFVVDQLGGCWSAGMPGFAQPFPPGEDAPTWMRFGSLDRGGLTAECDLSDLATRLSLPFDRDDATGAAQQTLTLAAATAAEYGQRTATLELPWLHRARDALAVGVRWLHWRARPLWTLKFQAGPDARRIPPGAWIELTGADSPIQGRAVVLDLDPGIGSGVVTIIAQAPAGAVPAVALEQHSGAFAATHVAYALSLGGDEITFTATDSEGIALPGARVWLDTQGPRIADRAGRVTFIATQGSHVVRVEAEGYSPMRVEITL